MSSTSSNLTIITTLFSLFRSKLHIIISFSREGITHKPSIIFDFIKSPTTIHHHKTYESSGVHTFHHRFLSSSFSLHFHCLQMKIITSSTLQRQNHHKLLKIIKTVLQSSLHFLIKDFLHLFHTHTEFFHLFHLFKRIQRDFHTSFRMNIFEIFPKDFLPHKGILLLLHKIFTSTFLTSILYHLNSTAS